LVRRSSNRVAAAWSVAFQTKRGLAPEKNLKMFCLARQTGYNACGSEAKTTVQSAMQRFQVTRAVVELTDTPDSSEDGCPSETNKLVPDSFSDWLAQPSQTITAGPDPEQGIFVGLLNECHLRMVGTPAAHLRRP
jgi:hypothetical protein